MPLALKKQRQRHDDVQVLQAWDTTEVQGRSRSPALVCRELQGSPMNDDTLPEAAYLAETATQWRATDLTALQVEVTPEHVGRHAAHDALCLLADGKACVRGLSALRRPASARDDGPLGGRLW